MPLKRKNRISLVAEKDASGRTLEIYQELKQALGLPHVNAFFQAFASHPRFLELQWQAFRPVAGTGEFFQLAGRLRAEAYTRVQNYFSVPDLGSDARRMEFSAGALHELSDTVELFHYSDSLFLLLSAAQAEAFEELQFRQAPSVLAPDHLEFTERPISVPEENAPAPTRKLYEEIRVATGLPFVNSEYRAFARWPEFLAEYWKVLKPALASPLYGEHRRRMREAALTLALELPGGPALSVQSMVDAHISDEEVSAIIRLTEVFLDVLSGMVLNVAFAKVGLEGGTMGKIPPLREPMDISRHVRR